MKRILSIVVIIWMLVFVGESKAVVLTFDNLPVNGNTTIPSPYGGLYWSLGFHYTFSAYSNGRVSGVSLAFNDLAGDTSAYTPTGTFDWDGAYFTSYWGINDLNIDIKGWSGGTLLYSTTVSPAPLPTWSGTNWMNIDTLTFHSYRTSNKFTGSHFLMDDFTFNEPIPSVPEPSTIALLGIGLAGLAGAVVKRRFKMVRKEGI